MRFVYYKAMVPPVHGDGWMISGFSLLVNHGSSLSWFFKLPIYQQPTSKLLVGR
jgi:hypothetical protein